MTLDLRPVDEVTITILVDNVFDSLLASTGPARRAAMAKIGRVPAPHYGEGSTTPGLRAEHGFAALVTVRTGAATSTVLLDTGISPDGMISNADLLGVDLALIEAVILSHGHFDHTAGLGALAARRQEVSAGGLPLLLHPHAWSRRRSTNREGIARDLPTLSRAAVESLGYAIVERSEATLLADEQILVTGEIDRTTWFERGVPRHEAYRDGQWVADPLLLDDQAIAIHLRGRGLVVLTGCGHAGVINTVRQAFRLAGVGHLHALLGGFHLSGPAFEPVIEPTVEALRDLAPEVLVPAHCTGWAAQHRLASEFPAAFIPNAVGTTFTLTGL
ncbi:MAG: MBL fold metallo-hydrolase [Micromonosporaceae bacterium]|nr:MBL fold metallo-hydrolase [Micromonosporaceae bacterium]